MVSGSSKIVEPAWPKKENRESNVLYCTSYVNREVKLKNALAPPYCHVLFLMYKKSGLVFPDGLLMTIKLLAVTDDNVFPINSIVAFVEENITIMLLVTSFKSRMLLYVKTSLLMFPREILSFSSFSGRILWTVLREKTTSLHIVENKIDIL